MKTISFGFISMGSAGMAGGGMLLILLISAILSFASWKNSREGKLLTESFSEPLGGATNAKVEINMRKGNLLIDRLTGSEEVLASGSYQYLGYQGLPARTVIRSNGQAAFLLKANGKGLPWFWFPWLGLNGAAVWQIHLNPSVPSDITVSSGGGDVKLNLAGMTVSRVSADTGGGSMEISLPENAANLSVVASTGGGNVTVEIGSGITGNSAVTAQSGGGTVVVRLPGGTAARIIATSGWGKIVVDPTYVKLGEKTYQSPDYEQAANKVDITAQSGAGNVTVITR